MDIRSTLDKLEQIHLFEEEQQELTKAHVEHPEDLVFHNGSQGAERGLQAIVGNVKNPTAITIKWDGYPALIFGRGMDKKFIICDKHMFNKKDGSGHVTSPQAFLQYDQARGVERGDLAQVVGRIWKGLEQSYSGTGFYWGDFLFSKPLKEQNGLYTFKANPEGITYTVEAKGNWVGELITGKQAGIAVHQYIPQEATNVQYAQPLNGGIGQLQNNSDVAIIPAKMPIVPKLKLNNTDVNKVQQVISKNASAVNQWILQAPPGVKTVFPLMCTVFINSKIVAGNLDNMVGDFMKFAENRKMSDPVRAKLLGYMDPATGKPVPGHFQNNTAGITGAFEIWIALYNLKMKVVPQLDKAAEQSPVKGYLADGTQTQEGFVGQGVKLINRMGFSRQNLAGRLPK